MEPKDVFIAVMGMTGAGKSTFVNTASDVAVEIGHSLQACTQSIEVIDFQLDQYTIHLIDTPGFDDTTRSDVEILENIAAWLEAANVKAVHLSGIIYLHRLTDNRMTGSAAKNLRMMKKLCGAENLANVALVTTMWENIVSQSEGERREKELTSVGNFWGSLIAYGSHVHRHYSNKESAIEIIRLFLDKNPVTLQIQSELSQGKALADTEAGKEVLDEMAQKARVRERELKELREEMRKAMESSSRGAEELRQRLVAERDALLAQKERDMQERLRMSEAHGNDLRNRIVNLERQLGGRRSICTIA